MASAPPSPVTTEIVIFAILVLFLVRRTLRMVSGAVYSVGRVFVFAALYILLFVALAFTTLFAAVVDLGPNAYSLLLPYAAVPVVAGLFAAPYIRRAVAFEHRVDGQLYYRLSWYLPALYLTLFVTRFVAEFLVLGPSALTFAFPPPTPSSLAGLYALIGVDLLFGVSLGLLVGRGVGVYLAHGDFTSQQTAPPPSPPLPSG